MDFTSRESSTAEPSLSIRWQSCSLHHNFAAACRGDTSLQPLWRQGD